MGVERQGPAGVLEEPLAQRGGLVGLPERLLDRRDVDDVGQAGRVGAIGRSSCQERVADRSTRICSTSLRGWRSVAQASSRPWKAPASSPGRTSVLAFRPCLTALNFARSLPSGVLGPVLFWALRRLASARFVVVALMVASAPGAAAAGGASPRPGQ